MGRLVIDGTKVYELDEACIEEKKKKEQETIKKQDIEEGEGHKKVT